MTGLQTLYKDMKIKNETYTIFDCQHNKIKLIMLFDISSQPFSLLLFKRRSSQNLLLDIQQGFMLNPSLSQEQYKTLLQILEIQNGATIFRTSVFFQELNSKIPCQTSAYEMDTEIRKIISCARNFEEKDKIFLYGYIDWDKIESNKRYTQANREKTRILYPPVYNTVKDKNISVRYTDDCQYEKNQYLDDLKAF